MRIMCAPIVLLFVALAGVSAPSRAASTSQVLRIDHVADGDTINARSRHLGLWGRCPGTLYDPYDGVSTGPPR